VLQYARKTLTVRVLDVPERVTPKLRPDALYEILAERREDPRDWLE
jgi:ribosomal 50S subunit-recycling heat shock protein